jgi:hypothetical protein
LGIRFEIPVAGEVDGVFVYGALTGQCKEQDEGDEGFHNEL